MFNFWPTVYAVTYANLAMAHSAVQMGLKSYGVVSWSIRARLHKGLLTGTMDVGSLFADVREMPNDRCVYCAAEPPPSLYADHQIPRARGGPESGDNLVWACLSCNSRKHSRDPLEWFDLWAHSRRSRCCDGT